MPGAPEASEKVLGIMAKPDADLEDMLYLFYPETDAARASGHEHFAHVATRLAAGGPAASGAAAQGMLAAIGQLLAAPFDQVQAELEGIQQPVLYANGLHDVMVPAHLLRRRPAPAQRHPPPLRRRRPRLPLPARQGLHQAGGRLPCRLNTPPAPPIPTPGGGRRPVVRVPPHSREAA
ncbi:hypothetical protein ACWD26_42690, partial [Streptomyces sp. NPDC002787]